MVRNLVAALRSWPMWLAGLAIAVIVYESVAVEWVEWLILFGGAIPFAAVLAVQMRYFLAAAVPLYRGTVGSASDRGRIFRRAVASYLMVVFEFALVFTIISRFDPAAFNVGELDLPSAIYFSAVTIATVGFGDIAAVDPLVRLLVVGEIAVGLAYVAFVFAMLAGLRVPDGSGGAPGGR